MEGFRTPEDLSSLTVFNTIGIKRDKRVAQFALLRRTPNLCNSNVPLGLVAGGGGIRTHETLAGLTAFKVGGCALARL